MSDDETTLNTKVLESLIKALKENNYVTRVGILGGKDARTGASNSNATIGAAHEFGTTKIPRRSFLRMPLENQFSKELEKAGLMNEKDINQIIKDTSMLSFAKKIGGIAVATILKAFDTAGFGTWKPLKDETMEKKKVKQILVESHQLRDSIIFEAKKTK